MGATLSRPRIILPDLPTELLLQIAEYLPQPDLYSLFLTCRRLNHACTPRLQHFAEAPHLWLPALQWAASRGHTHLVKILLSRGHDPNSCPQSSISLMGPWPPIEHAIKRHRVPIVKLLLDHGADVDSCICEGDTPVHTVINEIKRIQDKQWMALQPERPNIDHEIATLIEILKLILDKHPDLGVKSCYGLSPLHLAARSQLEGIAVDLLLDAGADVDQKTDGGSCSLHLAVRSGSAEVVRTLLRRGADIESRDENGMTPVIQAAYYGADKVLEVLVEGGADMHARDNEGLGVQEHNVLLEELVAERDRERERRKQERREQ